MIVLKSLLKGSVSFDEIATFSVPSGRPSEASQATNVTVVLPLKSILGTKRTELARVARRSTARLMSRSLWMGCQEVVPAAVSMLYSHCPLDESTSMMAMPRVALSSSSSIKLNAI